ncbi:hypothetical protein [Singulisphaera sp. PoT]|uniref:hypothetical protein n=1 Tax=Singulisphaera sp. PoT TaxID=3411797 RepID=UPI003BF594DE
MGIEIAEGGVYTNYNATFAREIVQIDGKYVFYSDYLLTTGEPLSTRGRCIRPVFRRWAVRPCTPEEMSRLKRDAEPREDRHLIEMLGSVVEDALGSIPDADLLAEVRRRGLISE